MRVLEEVRSLACHWHIAFGRFFHESSDMAHYHNKRLSKSQIWGIHFLRKQSIMIFLHINAKASPHTQRWFRKFPRANFTHVYREKAAFICYTTMAMLYMCSKELPPGACITFPTPASKDRGPCWAYGRRSAKRFQRHNTSLVTGFPPDSLSWKALHFSK